MKNCISTLVLFQLFAFQSMAQHIEMKGKVVDFETKEPVEFVNIGIVNKNKGTISNPKGEFGLDLQMEFVDDSLTISHVNYYPLKIPIENFQDRILYLKPKTVELAEVILSSKPKRTRKIGVKSHNPFLWLGALSEDMDIVENAQRINIPNQSVRVKKVNLYLRAGFKADSSYVRVNFYSNEDDAPGERIIFENILRKKKIEPGWLQIDLTDQFIYVDEDFFVGIEFIPDFKNPLEVYLGAILTKGKGYSRRSSHGQWNKLQGASTIYVEIEY